LQEGPHFALHRGIAICFLKATGFRNKPKRTIFDVWCGDPRWSLATEPETFKGRQCWLDGLDERRVFRENVLLPLDARTVGRVNTEVAGIRREVGKRRCFEIFPPSKDAICGEMLVAVYCSLRNCLA
jgi:hypothetical protein